MMRSTLDWARKRHRLAAPAVLGMMHLFRRISSAVSSTSARPGSTRTAQSQISKSDDWQFESQVLYLKMHSGDDRTIHTRTLCLGPLILAQTK